MVNIPDKINRWMLKTLEEKENLKRNRVFHSYKVPPPRYLLNRGKGLFYSRDNWQEPP